MSRMSAEKRLELGASMVERWKSAGFGSDRAVAFVKDMMARMTRGKGLTPRQREWYDSAVLADPPKPKNEDTVGLLRAAAVLPGMEKVSQVLEEFAYKLSRGWDLSANQVSFMHRLLDQAEEIRKHGIWEPTPEQRGEIALSVALSRRYTDYYLDGCPGIKSALTACKAWLAGEARHVDKWSAEKMMNRFKGDRQKMADAQGRWPVGSLVTLHDGRMGLIVGSPEADSRGRPCMPVLVDGLPTHVIFDCLVKPRKKRG